MKIKQPQAKFVKVQCPKCNNEQIIYTKAATTVSCTVCGEVLAKPQASTVKMIAKTLEIVS
ncbi:MAG: 30S ribosomal protein S27e [Candidatus Woesearchaeota archaeon]